MSSWYDKHKRAVHQHSREAEALFEDSLLKKRQNEALRKNCREVGFKTEVEKVVRSGRRSAASKQFSDSEYHLHHLELHLYGICIMVPCFLLTHICHKKGYICTIYQLT